MLPVGQAPDGSGDQTGPPLAWSRRPGGQEGWERGHCLWPTPGACRTNGDLSRRRDGKWTEMQGWAGASGEAQKTLPSWVLLSHWTKSAGVLVLRSVPALLPPCWEKAGSELWNPSVVSMQLEWGDCCSSDHLPPGYSLIHSFIHWSWHRGSIALLRPPLPTCPPTQLSNHPPFLSFCSLVTQTQSVSIVS